MELWNTTGRLLNIPSVRCRYMMIHSVGFNVSAA